MGPMKLVCRSFGVAAITFGLLVLACPQGQSATTQKLFDENWHQKEQCVNAGGSSGQTCEIISGGKFTITAKFSATGLSPSVLSSSTQFDISLASSGGSGSSGSVAKSHPGAKAPTLHKASGSSGGSGTSVGTGYFFKDTNVSSDFKIKTSQSKTTATRSLFTQKCNAQGKGCNSHFKYEKIELTITTQGDLEITITAKTGVDFNGDTFENSIDAESFDGDSGPVTDSLFLQVDLGSFSFNDADTKNVAVTGNASTQTVKSHGTSVGSLSDVTTSGTFQP